MLQKTVYKSTLVYIVIVLIERLSAHIEILKPLYYFAKPAIVLSLLFYFFSNSKHLNNKTKNLTVIALIFCVLGDVLLMFQEQSPNFFIGGLGAFLIGHIFYSLLFNTKRNTELSPILFIASLLVYASALFYLVIGKLGQMLVPVVLYILIILTMATLAYLRKDKVPKSSYIWILAGAIIFMLSDSTIAINKFYKPFSYSGDMIMITYALAQYLIVFGVLKQRN